MPILFFRGIVVPACQLTPPMFY